MADIRALIVDDEPLARRGIRQLLAAYDDIVVVGECRDGREAVRALATLAPDLVFLDVQMPGFDGLDVVRTHGPDRMPVTVFVTAHDQFAVRAFEAQALDYLVKPLSEARFRQTIARVRERMRLRDAASLAGRLSALLGGGPAAAPPARGSGTVRIPVPTATGELFLEADDVRWVEADGDHAVIYAERPHRLRTTLNALERQLPSSRFARVHRSALVRLDCVRELRGEGADATLVLHDGTTIPVSRRRLADVRALLKLA